MAQANAKLMEMVTGALSGVVLDKLLDKTNTTQQVVFEHVEQYHLGLTAFGVARVTNSPFAKSLATTMFVIELTKDDPFGLNQDPVTVNKNVRLGLLLLSGILMVEANK